MKRWHSRQYLFVLIILTMTLLYNKQAYSQKPQEAPQMPRVAVKEPSIGDGVKKYSQKHLNPQTILAEMETSLTATRKFEVLTRQKSKLEAIRDEQKFAKSDFAKGNAAEEGKIENANYLIIPTIQDFKFYRSSKPVPNISNKYIRKDSGMIEVNAQVIDTESGQVKTTFYLKSSFATKDAVVNTKGGVPSSVHFTRMAKKVASQMADQLVDTVFPMLVLNTEGEHVWINRGKDGGLKVGEILKVYKPGKELIDPYTKKKLGTAESFIGKVKVVRVNPKFTIATIITKGLKESVDVGYIVRKP